MERRLDPRRLLEIIDVFYIMRVSSNVPFLAVLLSWNITPKTHLESIVQ